MTRHPVVRRWLWPALVIGVVALVGVAALARVAWARGLVFASVLPMVGVLVLIVIAGFALSRVRPDSCSVCGAPLQMLLVQLPIEVAGPLAAAVEERGSLAPALPNHLAHPGQPAYTMLVGEHCGNCRRTARVHVAKVQMIKREQVVAEAMLSMQPLTQNQLLDEESAVFVGTLARRG